MNTNAIGRTVGGYGILSSIGYLSGSIDGMMYGILVMSILVYISNVMD